ncbi:hypothetical protein [Rhizomicrobium electricum]|uniref:Secreted protein n=1 Tax=Rhizomicrobium electricum TaxID=480070 RepID=A0ABN1EUC1_9PROT|nr:hypothetical protein [Rhizomicrobium electricum]NIJ49652.1 hypothetical protein [Rhizomicrobium electricum]
MNKTARGFLIAAVCAGPALAQSNDGYDPDRNCRIYVVQRLPVPVRCMAELLGNWSPKPYIDGEFMFRSRQEWLAWKDRDDYRRWKAHDYAAHAASPAPASPPSAPPPPVTTVANQPAASLYCPREISVRLTVDPKSLQGWSATDRTTVLRLEGSPRADGGTLICPYGQVSLSRPAWGRCTPRADGTGFDCTP